MLYGELAKSLRQKKSADYSAIDAHAPMRIREMCEAMRLANVIIAFFLFTAIIGPPLGYAAAQPELQIETVVRNLDTPWSIAWAPDGRIFVSERAGRIRVIENDKLSAEPWLTLEVSERGESGLLGLALDPNFAKNRYLYAAYTYRSGVFSLRNRLVRLREDAKSRKGVIDKTLIDNVDGAGNHDGGRVKFGPDGKLYWTTGDAQETALSQSLKSLSGKILRLNADGTVPDDNPFPNSYIYSYGHRNPQGLAWHPATGQLYATEHGPSGFQGCCRDEVNLIEPGNNYGWPEIRGDESQAGMITPIVHAGSSETWAPSGATFATTGPWAGSLLFVGLRGQTLYRVVLDAVNPRNAPKLERYFFRRYGRLRDIVTGPDDALYIITSNHDGRGSPGPEDDRLLRLRVIP